MSRDSWVLRHRWGEVLRGGSRWMVEAAVSSCEDVGVFRRAGLALACILAVLVMNGSAWGMAWSPAMSVGSEDLGSLSCPSVAFCLAVGSTTSDSSNGYPGHPVVWTSRDPADGAGAWRSRTGLDLGDVSCLSGSLCIATGMSVGNPPPGPPAGYPFFVAVSRHPTAGVRSWKLTYVDIAPTADEPGWGTGSDWLGPVSCPARSLCVTVDQAGEVVSSTNPFDRRPVWRVTQLYGEQTQCGGPPVMGLSQCQTYPYQPNLTGISCPSVSFCLAVDARGEAFSSTRPSTGPWDREQIDSTRTTCGVRQGAEPCTAPLHTLSCPAASLCVAGDEAGNVLSSTNPAGGPSAWTTVPVEDHSKYNGYIDGLSCPSVSFCTAVDTAGNVLSSTDPAGGRPAWTSTAVDPGHYLTALSCPSVHLCVATGEDGFLFGTSGGVPTAAARSAVRDAVHHSCSGEQIARVLRAHGCATPFHLPGAGMLTITWLAAHRPKIALGNANVSGSGRVIVHVRLTNAGRKLLTHAGRTAHLRVIVTFRDLPGHLYSAAARTTLTFTSPSASSSA